jgi:hypothetical protein
MAVSKIQRQKELLLEQLRVVPIVELAVKRTGISRATFYRWCSEDEAFKTDTENAKVDGIENINDMSEAQLIGMMKEKKYQATALWLKHNHPRFMSQEKQDRLHRAQKKAELRVDQQRLVKEALSKCT